MTEKLPRIAKYMLVAMSILAVLLVLFVNRNLAALAEWIYRGSEPWAHIVLLAVELVAFSLFWRGLFGGRRHLLLIKDASDEEKKRFAEELAKRLRRNPLLRKAEIVPENFASEEAYLAASFAFLKNRADKETEQTARRIFLATALAQNGRIDALIVFVCLCRLVWRISAIYNQRPHPRETASLYWAVATSTFLALSLEELDIATEITVGFGEAFQAMLPAGLTASIPFAGKALQTFTASAVDGAANCYLALRTGIIARNAYAYGARQEKRPSRAAVFREAGTVLYAMSGNMVERVAATIADGLAGAARNAGDRTLQAGKVFVEGIGLSAGKLASETATALQDTGRGIVRAGSRTLKKAMGGETGTAPQRPASLLKNKKE